jgi:hypothetical protein
MQSERDESTALHPNTAAQADDPSMLLLDGMTIMDSTVLESFILEILRFLTFSLSKHTLLLASIAMELTGEREADGRENPLGPTVTSNFSLALEILSFTVLDGWSAGENDRLAVPSEENCFMTVPIWPQMLVLGIENEIAAWPLTCICAV